MTTSTRGLPFSGGWDVSQGAEVVLDRVRKTFERGRIVALDVVSLRIGPGEFVSLTGPSGCGKSTLLNLIGGLDRPDSGRISVDGSPLDGLDLAEYRGATVGFVFQFHDLIPTLTALENVQVPMMARGVSRRERVARAQALLADVGILHRGAGYPRTLSGGERQRAAIARALANGPRLLLADEPTGALDSATGAQIVDVLQRLREQYGMTILLVTNDASVAERADRILLMRDGRLSPDAALRSA